MSKSKEIFFRVTSYEGDSEYSLLPAQAVAKIKQLAKEENKWCFVDGQPQNTELLTEKDLVTAQEMDMEIILMNSLAGGDDNPKVKINFEIVEKETGLIVEFTIDEDFGNKTIDITLGDDGMINFIHDREIILNAISRKLEEFAGNQVDGLREALNK